ncbi:hypothetical protein FQA39_LY07744 [Lamprigera yunnana]|nr:hypothetical protein FQA39_LY07744 [Lamprigera yunnana]
MTLIPSLTSVVVYTESPISKRVSSALNITSGLGAYFKLHTTTSDPLHKFEHSTIHITKFSIIQDTFFSSRRVLVSSGEAPIHRYFKSGDFNKQGDATDGFPLLTTLSNHYMKIKMPDDHQYESNKSSSNEKTFLQKLGVSEKWNLVDVFGLDSESLAWVPRPVASVILLFPTSDAYQAFSEKQVNEIKEKGQTLNPDLYYVKQIVSNACGTVALIHSVANNGDIIPIADGPFKKLLDESRNMTPLERGELLQKSAETILDAHRELSKEGQTTANPNEETNHHFVAFVHKNGNLYELDGRKEFPINHGNTTPENLLEDAAKICREYMEREADNHNFTVMALTSTEN